MSPEIPFAPKSTRNGKGMCNPMPGQDRIPQRLQSLAATFLAGKDCNHAGIPLHGHQSHYS